MKKLEDEYIVQLQNRFGNLTDVHSSIINELLSHIECITKDQDATYCAYCGNKYPRGTPKYQNEQLSEHIKVCPKHPMRKLELKLEIQNTRIKNLRKILIDSICGLGSFADDSSTDTHLSTLTSEIKRRNLNSVKKTSVSDLLEYIEEAKMELVHRVNKLVEDKE